MTTTLIPQSFWFRLAIPCPRVDGLPRPKGTRLLDLPPACRLPETGRLDGQEPWAQVRVGWNPGGLAVEVTVDGALDPKAVADVPDGAYGFNVWVDTRDTRDVGRATRFCHRFEARVVQLEGGSLDVEAQPRPIARAVADAPLCRPELLLARLERTRKTWRTELFLPAASLNGFDPETNRRLGFNYQVVDPARPAQFLGVGRDFPVGENPGLWSTLELSDG